MTVSAVLVQSQQGWDGGLTAGELRLAAAVDARRILRRVQGADSDSHACWARQARRHIAVAAL